MKTTLTGLLCCLALWVTLGEAQGQIRDDNASMAYLAIHCGASAGRLASSYEEYGAKLARTIGDLDVVQQERVFGYLPKPSGGSGSASDGSVLSPQTTASLADSLLAGGSPPEATSPNLGSVIEGENGSQTTEIQAGSPSSGGSDPGSEGVDGDSKPEDGGGDDQGGKQAMPRGYENLPDWLTNVIEQFESRFSQ